MHHINSYNHAIVLVDPNDEVNFYSFVHLQEYYDFFGIDSIKVFTNSKYIFDNYKELLHDSSYVKSVLLIDNSQKDFFIKCSRLALPYIILPSLTEPKDKNLNHLIGLYGLTIEDLVCLVEYRLFEYKKIKCSYSKN